MLIELTCSVCGGCFKRRRGEVNRSVKLGRPLFCSRSCSGKDHIKNFGDKSNKDASHLWKGMPVDEYSPFRVFMGRIKTRQRDKGRACDLRLQDLKELWDQQVGRCPYTGWPLQTPRSTGGKRDMTPDTASLDRIDSTKGYVKGNVEFVSLMAQYAKNTFAREDVLAFGRAVFENSSCANGRPIVP